MDREQRRFSHRDGQDSPPARLRPPRNMRRGQAGGAGQGRSAAGPTPADETAPTQALAAERSPKTLPRNGRSLIVVGQAILAAVSMLVLTVTGYAYTNVQNLTHGLTTSKALANTAKSKDGAVNILVMGLDSRKDQNGNPLSQAILDQLHAGTSADGGYNTNTLILMHIPNNGSAVSAFSIPRDDYVNYVDSPYGQDAGKIKEAYGLAKAAKEDALYKQGVTDHAALETQGREAGRASTLANVQALTGVPIDHFVEVTLAGFYDLASALGGVQVCLNNAVSDSYSGANFPKGPQTLNGSQALSFVRQRHGLLNGDLDRTHRQQAFLASVAHQLSSVGTFTNMSKLQALIDAAKKDVVVDNGFDLLSFAQQAQNLTSGKMQMQTLPILSYATINGQSVNKIDPVAVKDIVQTAFGLKPAPSAQSSSPAPANGGSTVDVVNAGGKAGEAAALSDLLAGRGYAKGTVGNATNRTTSRVLYGSGAKSDADSLSKLLGISSVVSSSAVSKGHVQIELAADFSLPSSLATSPQGVEAAPAPSPAPAPAPSIDPNAPQGAAVVGGGVPCVN